MAKKITGYIKLQIASGAANPSPPVGPALGQRGVNIMDFCKAFNAATQGKFPGMKLPVVITVYADRSFDFITKAPPASALIMQAANLKKGSGQTGKQVIGKISRGKLLEIAKVKIQDTNANDEDAVVRQLEGTALAMGLEVVEG